MHTAADEQVGEENSSTSPEPDPLSESTVALPAPTRMTPTDPYASRERHHNEGHGRRLTAAFEALEAFPVMAESRIRVPRLFEGGDPSTSDIVSAVEGDVALAIAADEARQPARRPHARAGRQRRLGHRGLFAGDDPSRSPAERAPTTPPSAPPLAGDPERFRLHSVATQRAADRLATEIGFESRDRQTVTALLHDIGKLVLVHAYPGYPRQVHCAAAAHPRGAVAARAPRARRRPRPRRWRARPGGGGFRSRSPTAIECHHSTSHTEGERRDCPALRHARPLRARWRDHAGRDARASPG